MKKSRAIDLLDNLIGMIEDNQDNDYDTAFRMAIEALKTQLSQEGTTSDQHVATDTNVGDTISRQAAIDAVNNAFDRETLLTGFVRSIAVRAIRDMPSAQPEPKEGHWIEGGIYRDVIECYCSECGQIMTTVATVRMNYCPRCGADMRGEQHG